MPFVALLVLPLCLVAADGSSDGVFGLRGRLREKRVERELADRIKALAAQLGHSSFRVRENCTRELIAIGKRNKTLRNLVANRMNGARRDRDPEVSERAGTVLKAIFPPPEVPAHLDAITRPS